MKQMCLSGITEPIIPSSRDFSQEVRQTIRQLHSSLQENCLYLEQSVGNFKGTLKTMDILVTSDWREPRNFMKTRQTIDHKVTRKNQVKKITHVQNKFQKLVSKLLFQRGKKN